MMNLRKHLANNKKAARSGFTLIELIVVLMILVGLAGLVIPAVTDMVVRTHSAAGAGNIAEVSNAVARYEAQYMSYPNNLDSLKNTLAGATVTDFNGLTTELTANCTALTLTADHVDALDAAGITTLALHADASATVDATFQATTPSAALAEDDVLLSITDGVTETSLGLDTAGTYVLLGVGNRSEAIGRTMTDAPVHFAENGAENPALVYNRFLAVFDVSGERAKLVKVISPHFADLDGHMQEYFEVVNDNQ